MRADSGCTCESWCVSCYRNSNLKMYAFQRRILDMHSPICGAHERKYLCMHVCAKKHMHTYAKKRMHIYICVCEKTKICIHMRKNQRMNVYESFLFMAVCECFLTIDLSTHACLYVCMCVCIYTCGPVDYCI
jgi:hypothetical protein